MEAINMALYIPLSIIEGLKVFIYSFFLKLEKVSRIAQLGESITSGSIAKIERQILKEEIKHRKEINKGEDQIVLVSTIRPLLLDYHGEIQTISPSVATQNGEFIKFLYELPREIISQCTIASYMVLFAVSMGWFLSMVIRDEEIPIQKTELHTDPEYSFEEIERSIYQYQELMAQKVEKIAAYKELSFKTFKESPNRFQRKLHPKQMSPRAVKVIQDNNRPSKKKVEALKLQRNKENFDPFFLNTKLNQVNNESLKIPEMLEADRTLSKFQMRQSNGIISPSLDPDTKIKVKKSDDLGKFGVKTPDFSVSETLSYPGAMLNLSSSSHENSVRKMETNNEFSFDSSQQLLLQPVSPYDSVISLHALDWNIREDSFDQSRIDDINDISDKILATDFESKKFHQEEINCFPIAVNKVIFNNKDFYKCNLLEESSRISFNNEFEQIQDSIIFTREGTTKYGYIVSGSNDVADNDSKMVKEKGEKSLTTLKISKYALSNTITEILHGDNNDYNNFFKIENSGYEKSEEICIALQSMLEGSENAVKQIITSEFQEIFKSDSSGELQILKKIRFILSMEFNGSNTNMKKIISLYKSSVGENLFNFISMSDINKPQFSQSIWGVVQDYLTYAESEEISMSNYKLYLQSIILAVGSDKELNKALSNCFCSSVIALEVNMLQVTYFPIFESVFREKASWEKHQIILKCFKYYICFNKDAIVDEFLVNPNNNKFHSCGYRLIKLFSKNINLIAETLKRPKSSSILNQVDKKITNKSISNPVILEMIEIYLILVEVFLNNDKISPSIQYELLTNYITSVYNKIRPLAETNSWSLEPPILKELQVNFGLK